MLKQLALLPALAASAHAATLSTYDFSQIADFSQFSTSYPDISRGNYLNSPQVLDPSPYLAGGVTNQWDGNIFSASVRRGGSPVSGFITIDTLDKAISYGAYFSIAYTPAGDTSFSSITFDAAGSGTSRITLRSSVTGTVNLAAALINTNINTGGQQTITFDLSSFAELQDVADPVTFTFYTDTNGGSATSPTIYIDDLTFNGTQSIPEPSSLGLLAAAASAFILRRRVRRP
jgi:hypothetical protein